MTKFDRLASSSNMERFITCLPIGCSRNFCVAGCFLANRMREIEGMWERNEATNTGEGAHLAITVSTNSGQSSIFSLTRAPASCRLKLLRESKCLALGVTALGSFLDFNNWLRGPSCLVINSSIPFKIVLLWPKKGKNQNWAKC